MAARMGYWASLFDGYSDREERNRGGGLSALFMIILAPIAATLIQLPFRARASTRPTPPVQKRLAILMLLLAALQKLDASSRRIPLAASPFDGASIYRRSPAGVRAASLIYSRHILLSRRGFDV